MTAQLRTACERNGPSGQTPEPKPVDALHTASRERTTSLPPIACLDGDEEIDQLLDDDEYNTIPSTSTTRPCPPL